MFSERDPRDSKAKIEAMLAADEASKGQVHYDGESHGRFSCEQPNVQLPSPRTELGRSIAEMMRTKPAIFDSDYSAAEMRLAAEHERVTAQEHAALDQKFPRAISNEEFERRAQEARSANARCYGTLNVLLAHARGRGDQALVEDLERAVLVVGEVTKGSR